MEAIAFHTETNNTLRIYRGILTQMLIIFPEDEQALIRSAINLSQPGGEEDDRESLGPISTPATIPTVTASATQVPTVVPTSTSIPENLGNGGNSNNVNNAGNSTAGGNDEDDQDDGEEEENEQHDEGEGDDGGDD